jgi:hypothetical protein
MLHFYKPNVEQFSKSRDFEGVALFTLAGTGVLWGISIEIVISPIQLIKLIADYYDRAEI